MRYLLILGSLLFCAACAEKEPEGPPEFRTVRASIEPIKIEVKE